MINTRLRLGPLNSDRDKVIAFQEIQNKINQIFALAESGELVSGATVSWDEVSDKPSTFDPSEHNHDDRYYRKTETYSASQVDALLADFGVADDDSDFYTKSEVNHLLSEVSLPAYGAAGGYVRSNGSAWVRVSGLAWADVTGHPTTLGGYGITDAALEADLLAHLADVANPHAVTKTQVGLGLVENTALSTWAGSSNITVLGTIATGEWNATAIAWAKVDKTGSSLADLATRSAGDLSSGNLAYAQMPNVAGVWAVGGTLSITGGVTTVAGLTSTGAVGFSTNLISTTALATPSALAATQFTAFASTTLGAAIMGFGTARDVSLLNQAGTVVLGILPNTTTVQMAGALNVSGGVNVTGTLRVGTGASDVGLFQGQTAGSGAAFFALDSTLGSYVPLTFDGSTIALRPSGTAVLTTSAVTVTLAGDLKFTDATYDIGKSGATRPRDVFTSRNATIGGGLIVTGSSGGYSAQLNLNQNNITSLNIANTTSGIAAEAAITLAPHLGEGELHAFSDGYTTVGAYEAGACMFAAIRGSLNLVGVNGSAGVVKVYTGGSAAGNLRATWSVGGALTLTGALTVAGLDTKVQTETTNAGALLYIRKYQDVFGVSTEGVSLDALNSALGATVPLGLRGSIVTISGATTILGDLKFTDATYDIGKSGATRPRDGFFSRNLTVGAALGATGLISASGGVRILGGSFAAGSFYKNATAGLNITGIAGSLSDFSFADHSGNNAIDIIAAGTTPTVKMYGDLILTSAQKLWLDNGSSTYLYLVGSGIVGAAGALQTSTPSGGTAKPWKFGSVITGEVGLALNTTSHVELDVNGTLVKLALIL